MNSRKLLKKISLGVASLALICPLAMSGLNNVNVNAKRRHIRTHRTYHHYRRTKRSSHKSYIKKCYRDYNYDLKKNGKADVKFWRKTHNKNPFRLKHAVRAYYYKLSDRGPVYDHIIGMKTLHKGTKVHAYYQGTEGVEWNAKAKGLHTSSHVVASMTLTSSNARLI